MRGVVLAEYKVHQTVFIIHDGQAVELVFPDDVVCFLQSGLLGSGDQLCTGSHEGRNLVRGIHTGNAVVTAGDDAQELAVGSAVLGDGHGGEAVAFFQSQNVSQSMIRSQVGSRGDEASLVALDLGNHGSLLLDGLRTIDKADTAFLCKSNGQSVVGNRLHNSRSHGNVQRDGGLFHALAVLNEGGLQANTVGDTLFRSVTGDQKIFAEGVAGFRIVVSHCCIPPVK